MNEMRTPPSIVVGIDGSKAALRAALWAVDEAVSRDIPLRLLYAIEPDDAPQTSPHVSAQKLAAAENAVRYAFTAVESTEKPVKIEVEITQERAVTALTRASETAAMVCIGAVGAHDFRGGRVGSTAAALAVSGHCPVAIIRNKAHWDGRDSHWIVVETHGSAENAILLRNAIEEARLRNAPMRVITCQQAGEGEVGEKDVADDGKWMQCYPELQAESVRVHGCFLDYLALNSRSVQLVVLAASDTAEVRQLLGPTGNAVLHRTDCSVLIVHQPTSEFNPRATHPAEERTPSC
jgi:nucleotide-binding universal stress UspA family protein